MSSRNVPATGQQQSPLGLAVRVEAARLDMRRALRSIATVLGFTPEPKDKWFDLHRADTIARFPAVDADVAMVRPALRQAYLTGKLPEVRAAVDVYIEKKRALMLMGYEADTPCVMQLAADAAKELGEAAAKITQHAANPAMASDRDVLKEAAEARDTIDRVMQYAAGASL